MRFKHTRKETLHFSLVRSQLYPYTGGLFSHFRKYIFGKLDENCLEEVRRNYTHSRVFQENSFSTMLPANRKIDQKSNKVQNYTHPNFSTIFTISIDVWIFIWKIKIISLELFSVDSLSSYAPFCEERKKILNNYVCTLKKSL